MDIRVVVVGDGVAYVVMFHCHGIYAKTPTKTEADTSFQCLGGGGLVFFSFLFPLKISSNKTLVFFWVV